jgi:putative addiction module component (TIGR02574 family)
MKMATRTVREKALSLPTAEKLSLVQELWDSIAEDSETVALSESEKRLLDQRVQSDRRDPNAAQPWAVVKRRALAKVKATRRDDK